MRRPSRETVLKMCRFSLPPGYTRTRPVAKPKLGPLLPVIDAILEADRTGHVRQDESLQRVDDGEPQLRQLRELAFEVVEEGRPRERLTVGGDQRARPASVRQRQYDQPLRTAQPTRVEINAVKPPVHGIEAVLGRDHHRGAFDRDTPAQNFARLFESGDAGGDLKRKIEGKIAFPEAALGGDQRRDAERDRAAAKPACRRTCAVISSRWCRRIGACDSKDIDDLLRECRKCLCLRDPSIPSPKWPFAGR